ncbi:methionine ABC transporter substrate-binding protein [Sneathia sp. DSM 16630]|jgi:hypothetical protein|nr:methionine ABC transporter substrate-binding protein [Sneathia sp. DSM 16630]
MIKKILLFILLTLTLVSCSGKKNNTLVIGVSPVPHKEIVEAVKDDLKKEGIDLKIVVFNDYVQPNLGLKDKSLDANFFQHIPYMIEFGKKNNIDLVSVGAVHLEPLKLYSDKYTDVKQLPKHAKILIPNDPTNKARALTLLKDLKDLDITPLNAEQIGPRLKEVDGAVINTNFAISSKIPQDKAILVESKDSPYANIVTVLKGRENDEKIKKLMKALRSEKVKKFIEEKYNGLIIPAF